MRGGGGGGGKREIKETCRHDFENRERSITCLIDLASLLIFFPVIRFDLS